jgi:DNA mismatch repair ATPase MutS
VLLDQQTSGDLEIFRTRDGRPGVFQTLDRTKTPGGREALKARFANPMDDAGSIRWVQDGIRFLLDEEVSFPLDPNHLLEVRQYLDSTWDVGSRARGIRFLVESILVSIRYRDLFRLALRGVGVTRHMLAELDLFLDEVNEKGPPDQVRELMDAIRGLLDGMEPGLAGGARRPWSVFKADRFFRLLRSPEMDRLFELVADLDALLAMGEVMRELDLPFPEVVDSPHFLLEGEGLVHPFLKNPVGNPVSLGGSGKTLIFLTGPNMAGKTTYLKSVGVAAYLAHLGMGVPARSLRFTPLGGLYSSLSPEENLREGLSYFMAEVHRVRTMAEAVAQGDRTLVLVDEAFRGTNVKDALDASLMVIRGFARCRESGFIFSSHLVELAEDLEGEPQADFAFFEGQIQDGKASYDFRLREGVSAQRFGLQLLDEAGVPQILDSVPSNRAREEGQDP